MIEDIRYKEAWITCKCGSKIYFNSYNPGKVPELCNRCQKIADMRQTKIHEWDGRQKKIEHFNGDE